jgi:predicted permease
MTYLVILAFVAILGSLATALYFMLRGGSSQHSKSKNMARALGLRVGVSIFLFLCILLAWKLGYIHPTGIQEGQ